ncbi:hypothetical protein CGI24_24375 [Vibrio parahaemolyticus]|uniref:hypothetical protein n=1 Tax=Vibrio TaxID=662 RepID=UPI00111F5263|nr:MULTISPECIES: hypothetical protein [Vibrio]MDF4609334.1 hypothetical protein [Vibrio parahaemolyticus]MDF4647532.1 hypothetical protein [Vibrio parahaemolyticus]MDF4652522.1 hypothetical protein [Vibrio parahaemolyticus]MDF4662367.1 hypothetical protein [Vibrio parahaemolyticus]MDF4706753.1 hypothetical protein [Vibrio parahaemolyticus]
MSKTDEDIANVKRINSGMRVLSHSVWRKVHQPNFRSFTQFDQMFWDVTNRAWLSVDHSAFSDKLEFAHLYWADYCKKNLAS